MSEFPVINIAGQDYIRPARTRFHSTEDRLASVTLRAGQNQLPAPRSAGEGIHEPGGILALLQCTNGEHDWLAFARRGGSGNNAMMDYVDPFGIYTKQSAHLTGGEPGDGDNSISAIRRLSRLFGKAPPEFRSGVFSSQYE